MSFAILATLNTIFFHLTDVHLLFVLLQDINGAITGAEDYSMQFEVSISYHLFAQKSAQIILCTELIDTTHRHRKVPCVLHCMLRSALFG